MFSGLPSNFMDLLILTRMSTQDVHMTGSMEVALGGHGSVSQEVVVQQPGNQLIFPQPTRWQGAVTMTSTPAAQSTVEHSFHTASAVRAGASQATAASYVEQGTSMSPRPQLQSAPAAIGYRAGTLSFT